jgi:hypothetical protein
MRTITGFVAVCLLLPFLSAGCRYSTLRITRIEDAFAVEPPTSSFLFTRPAFRLTGEFSIEEGLLFDVSRLAVSRSYGKIECTIALENVSTCDVTIRSENFKFLLLADGGGKEPLETDYEIQTLWRGKITGHNPFSEPVVLKPGEGIDVNFTSFLKNGKIPRPVRIQLLVSGITVGDKEVSFSVYAEE